MAVMTVPDFRLNKRNPNPTLITDAEWWLWERCQELEPRSEYGGIYANKPGFHNTGAANAPGNYSIRDPINRTGPWWETKASALDWTFPDAQAGDFRTINKYTSRLMASAQNARDPRLDLILFEFYGQADNDRVVEGWNEYREETVSSDSSHLWHIHESFLRSKCGDFWGMWALHTVHMGWSVAQWRASLPQSPKEIGIEVIDMVFLQVKGQAAVYESSGGYTRAMPGGTWSTYCKPLIDAGVPFLANFNTLDELLLAGGPLRE